MKQKKNNCIVVDSVIIFLLLWSWMLAALAAAAAMAAIIWKLFFKWNLSGINWKSTFSMRCYFYFYFHLIAIVWYSIKISNNKIICSILTPPLVIWELNKHKKKMNRERKMVQSVKFRSKHHSEQKYPIMYFHSEKLPSHKHVIRFKFPL